MVYGSTGRGKVQTWNDIGEGVEHGLGVQAGGQGLVLRGECGQGILPTRRELSSQDRVQLGGLLCLLTDTDC